MGKHFSDTFLSELTNRTDLVSLIEASRVQLKKHGNEYAGCCPFHDEKTPSFTVSPQKGFFHCFGCKAHGNAIDFVKMRDNCSFPEAVRLVAEFAGVAVPESERDPEQHDMDREAVKVLNVLAGFYENALAKNMELQAELKELWGLSDDLIRELRLGYAPARYRLPRGSDEAHRRANIVDTRRGGPKVFDKLIVPLVNHKGTVLGFSALPRPSTGERRETKMGIQTAAHHCFGLEYVRKELDGAVADHIFVVPRTGEMLRGLALGLRTVSPAGAALIEPQAIKLVRHARSVVAAFPGNAIGRKLALEVALKIAGMRTTTGLGTVRMLFAPPGEDFSTFMKVVDPSRVTQMASSLPSALDFLVDEVGARFDLSTTEGRNGCWERGLQVLDCFQAGDFGHLVVANELQRALTIPYSDAMRNIHGHTLETVAESLTLEQWQSEEPGRRALRALLADPTLAQSQELTSLINTASTPAGTAARTAQEYLLKGGASVEGAFDGDAAIQTALRIMREELDAATTYSPEEVLRPFADVPRPVASTQAEAHAVVGQDSPSAPVDDEPADPFELPERVPRKRTGRFIQKAKIR